jgi:hypothetical protein
MTRALEICVTPLLIFENIYNCHVRYRSVPSALVRQHCAVQSFMTVFTRSLQQKVRAIFYALILSILTRVKS